MMRFENLKVNALKLMMIFGVFILSLASCQSHHQNSEDNDGGEHAKSLDNPFIHSVYFWFKEGVTQEQLDAFYTDSKQLAEISSVRGYFYGKPAATDRPIVERSYDYAVVVHFEDLAGHDVYQADPIHLNLLKTHSDLWERVMITDIDPH